jgi:hypothetical protein
MLRRCRIGPVLARRKESRVAGIEERVARVEAHTEALIRTVEGIHADIADIRLDIRAMRGDMNRLADRVDQKIAWVVGTQVATLIAVVGVLAAAVFR